MSKPVTYFVAALIAFLVCIDNTLRVNGTPKPRHYRNRRLGDFLKELDLTEGKSTGITTVRAKLKSNGSPAAIYEFDEERTYFSATVKIHPEFPIQQSDIDGTRDGTREKSRGELIIEAIQSDNTITREQIGQKIGISKRSVSRELENLKDKVRYIGRGDHGHWEVIK